MIVKQKAKPLNNDVPFQSIAGAARITGLSQYFLRRECKSGAAWCLRSGAKFIVNVPLLLQSFGVPGMDGGGSEGL